jgi:hypothetical protein
MKPTPFDRHRGYRRWRYLAPAMSQKCGLDRIDASGHVEVSRNVGSGEKQGTGRDGCQKTLSVIQLML